MPEARLARTRAAYDRPFAGTVRSEARFAPDMLRNAEAWEISAPFVRPAVPLDLMAIPETAACAHCQGDGWIYVFGPDHPAAATQPCPYCEGKGRS